LTAAPASTAESWIILGPLGIIFGGIGWRRANRGGSGKKMSVAAVVIGVIDVVIFVALVGAAAANNGSYYWRI
jgi:hypothetical protein